MNLVSDPHVLQPEAAVFENACKTKRRPSRHKLNYKNSTATRYKTRQNANVTSVVGVLGKTRFDDRVDRRKWGARLGMGWSVLINDFLTAWSRLRRTVNLI